MFLKWNAFRKYKWSSLKRYKYKHTFFEYLIYYTHPQTSNHLLNIYLIDPDAFIVFKSKFRVDIVLLVIIKLKDFIHFISIVRAAVYIKNVHMTLSILKQALLIIVSFV